MFAVWSIFPRETRNDFTVSSMTNVAQVWVFEYLTYQISTLEISSMPCVSSNIVPPFYCLCTTCIAWDKSVLEFLIPHSLLHAASWACVTTSFDSDWSQVWRDTCQKYSSDWGGSWHNQAWVEGQAWSLGWLEEDNTLSVHCLARSWRLTDHWPLKNAVQTAAEAPPSRAPHHTLQCRYAPILPAWTHTQEEFLIYLWKVYVTLLR